MEFLIQDINNIIKYFGEIYDIRLSEYKIKELGELTTTYENEQFVEFKIETDNGFAWLQVNKEILELQAAEYTYNPENEFYMNADDEELTEFLRELRAKEEE